MKILLTGATGFVGRRIAQRLVNEGHEVTITSGGSGPHVQGVKKIIYRNLDGIDWTWVTGQDVVIHQMANNDTRCQDESEMRRANVFGPRKLFELAAAGGCKNFVYASSTAVYGAQPAPYVEDVTPVKPLNVYGHSKAEFDRFAMGFASDSIKVTGLRYCNVYGPGEDHKGKRMSMVGQILRTMLGNQGPSLFTDGSQQRDWIYVDDVVEMNMLAMNRTNGKAGEIYNCGSGTASSFNEIVRIINELGDSRFESTYIDCPFKDEYQNFTLCSMEKAGNDLGFVPRFDLRSGICEYLKSFTFLS